MTKWPLVLLLALLGSPAIGQGFDHVGESGLCTLADGSSAASTQERCDLANGTFIIAPRYYSSSASALTAFSGPTNLIITCGPGEVSISLKTGKVEFKNCPVDEGAQAFWAAIERMYPGQIPH